LRPLAARASGFGFGVAIWFTVFDPAYYSFGLMAIKSGTSKKPLAI
jgi:hypothetical protein